MSLSSLLSIARSALFAQQRAMDVTGHNVANASTPGYSRQRLDIHAADPQLDPLGPLGRGVTYGSVVRVRDVFLDDTFRRESGSLGSSDMLASFLSQVEGALGEPSETGVGAAIDGLFTAFADLAADPSNGVARDAVRLAGQRLAGRVRQLDGRIQQAAADALARLRAGVDELNSTTARIAELNAKILATGGLDGASPDLEDLRDQLVDQLSGMAGVTVVRHDDGTLGVMAGDTLVVDGGASQALTVCASGAGYGVALASGGGIVDLRGGSLGALSDLTANVLPGLRGQLDTLVAAIANEVNAIHRTGYTPGGATGTDFFDPAGLTAATFALAAPIEASSGAIAAAATNAPGDGAVALKLSALGGTALAALGGHSIHEFYTAFATGIGGRAQEAATERDTAQALTDNADAQRTSVSGVSLDEEMVALIAQQQAYGAAARLVTVAQEMSQSVLDILS